MKFRELPPLATFDFINPSTPGSNSFFRRCHKTGPRTYHDDLGTKHKVGSINAKVFNVQLPRKNYDELIAEAHAELERLIWDGTMMSVNVFSRPSTPELQGALIVTRENRAPPHSVVRANRDWRAIERSALYQVLWNAARREPIL
jgi:hypothetical protein